MLQSHPFRRPFLRRMLYRLAPLASSLGLNFEHVVVLKSTERRPFASRVHVIILAPTLEKPANHLHSRQHSTIDGEPIFDATCKGRRLCGLLQQAQVISTPMSRISGRRSPPTPADVIPCTAERRTLNASKAGTLGRSVNRLRSWLEELRLRWTNSLKSLAVEGQAAAAARQV